MSNQVKELKNKSNQMSKWIEEGKNNEFLLQGLLEIQSFTKQNFYGVQRDRLVKLYVLPLSEHIKCA